MTKLPLALNARLLPDTFSGRSSRWPPLSSFGHCFRSSCALPHPPPVQGVPVAPPSQPVPCPLALSLLLLSRSSHWPSSRTRPTLCFPMQEAREEMWTLLRVADCVEQDAQFKARTGPRSRSFTGGRGLAGPSLVARIPRSGGAHARGPNPDSPRGRVGDTKNTAGPAFTLQWCFSGSRSQHALTTHTHTYTMAYSAYASKVSRGGAVTTNVQDSSTAAWLASPPLPCRWYLALGCRESFPGLGPRRAVFRQGALSVTSRPCARPHTIPPEALLSGPRPLCPSPLGREGGLGPRPVARRRLRRGCCCGRGLGCPPSASLEPTPGIARRLALRSSMGVTCLASFEVVTRVQVVSPASSSF